VSKVLLDKKVTPSPLKFGFLGLGNMGSGIVKNLLNSGHKVIIWNRTSEKVRSIFNCQWLDKLIVPDILPWFLINYIKFIELKF